MAKKVPSIEQCFEDIEATIAALEDGELPLEEALKRYETALGQVRVARQHLDAFQAKLEELRDDEDAADAAAEGYEA